MRTLILGIALTLVATTASAQRVERVAVDNSVAERSPVTFASISLRITPADASAPWSAPAPAVSVSGGRVLSIALGALIGAGVVYGAMSSIDCSDCEGKSRTYGMAGGAVVGGFIGNAVWGYRQRKATIPPPEPR